MQLTNTFEGNTPGLVPVLKIRSRNILFGRASWALRQLTLHDAPDPALQRWMDRSECLAELRTIECELELIGESPDDFYAEIVSDAEARAEFDADSDE